MVSTLAWQVQVSIPAERAWQELKLDTIAMRYVSLQDLALKVRVWAAMPAWEIVN